MNANQPFNDLKKAAAKEEVMNERMGQLALQFAHDIRSPLFALNVLVNISKEQLSEDAKDLLQATIQRINSIAAELCAVQRAATAAAKEEAQAISQIIADIVAEKKMQYADKLQLTIEQDITQVQNAKINSTSELQRILSNLINNSVEAIGEAKGRVEVHARREDHFISVQIFDNGPGIPASALAKIGHRGFSYEKKDGNGLGVFHAKSCVEARGGIFNIVSKEGKGTTVTLTWPCL